LVLFSFCFISFYFGLVALSFCRSLIRVYYLSTVRLTAVALLHTKLIETDQTRSKLPFSSKIYNPVHFNTRLGIENRNKFNRDEGNASG
jgi:hypothetical protein